MVRTLRLDRGWTLEKASEATGLDFRHFQQIESGAINVTLATALRIADGFGVALAQLFPIQAKATRPGAAANANLEDGRRGTAILARRAKRERRFGVADAQANPIPGATTAEMTQRQVGKAVASFRRAAGMTQTALAKKVGVSLKYVQRVEAGKQNLTIASLVRFANALQVEPRQLFEPLYS